MVSHPDFDDVSKLWSQPEMSVLRQGRREPPELPIEVFGPFWSEWLRLAAAGASAPLDYTASALLACAAAVIGHARWVSPWEGWSEPPVLWIGNVGDPSSGKSPAADSLIRILRHIELAAAEDYPQAHRQWMSERASAAAHREIWESEVKTAAKAGKAPPDMPISAIAPNEPVRARIVVTDPTTEALAQLAAAHKRGLMLVRDELAGWYGSLGRYSKGGADRAFWVEAYGGRPYTVDRVKHAGLPIVIERLGVGIFGGIQPDRLHELLGSPDDGLLARFLWAWPNKVPARRPNQKADLERATGALSLFYELPLVNGEDGRSRPFCCPLSSEAADLFAEWWEANRTAELTGPLAGTLGKAPGHVIRLSLVLEHLWWCGDAAVAMPPSSISARAVAAALALVIDYFHPMAARVYGDAAIPERDRLATIIAKWILMTKPKFINARELRRTAGLPGLRESEKVKMALEELVEADWIISSPSRAGDSVGRKRDDYLVNPRLKVIPNV